MLFADAVYLVISEIYVTRQIKPKGLFDHFTIYFAYLFEFSLFILTVKFRPHL